MIQGQAILAKIAADSPHADLNASALKQRVFVKSQSPLKPIGFVDFFA